MYVLPVMQWILSKVVQDIKMLQLIVVKVLIMEIGTLADSYKFHEFHGESVHGSFYIWKSTYPMDNAKQQYIKADIFTYEILCVIILSVLEPSNN
jgi:hypothetical protein